MIKVLIVDDEVYNREILMKVLRKENMEVYEAINGKEALSRMGEDSFDIVLMDLMMPVMDGFEAIENIRTQIKSKVPIVVISAVNNKETMDRIEDMDISAFLSKPFNLRTLIKTIRDTLDDISV